MSLESSDGSEVSGPPRPPRFLRYGLYGVLAGALGLVVYLGASLAVLARTSGASTTTGSRRLPGGALLICGGGTLPDKVRERFIELAGGSKAKIIVIPTAHRLADGKDPEKDFLTSWSSFKVDSLKILHTRSRETANDPAFCKALTEATGVWIGGGQQAMVTSVYLGTEVERQLKALLARGGVIGGSSAGAAVMSKVMIASGQGKATLAEGFDFFPGAVFDQHFLRRRRHVRLLGVINAHPDLTGFGIDEGTALVVDVKNRRLNVIGRSYVVAFFPETRGEATSIRREYLSDGFEVDIDRLRKSPDSAIVAGLDLDAAEVEGD